MDTPFDIHSTLAIDAAKFNDVSGETIQKIFPLIQNIDSGKKYSNIFIYYLQPVNIPVKPFPIYAMISESGAANDDVIKIADKILEILEKFNVSTKFIATDGDHKYDFFHEKFFAIILHGFKSKMTFDQIILQICENSTIKIPISDFLHSIKILRSNLIKYGIEIDHKSNSTVLPEDLEEYDLGKALYDVTQNGKMKDAYPLEIFSEKNILKAFLKEDWNFVYFSMPINLLINAIRNPDLSNEMRLYFLEASFYFLIKTFYELPFFKSLPHSRIGIIRLINTVIGISVSLRLYEYVKIGHISTHPLENFYGYLRIACNYNHSCSNIFLSIAKTVLITKTLQNYNISSPIRSRLGYGGTIACAEKSGGNMPVFSPFAFFILIYQRMKDPSRIESNEICKWYLSFKTEPWDERIAIPSAFSGSNIFARYVSKSNIEGEKKVQVNMKRRKMDRYDHTHSLERSYGMMKKSKLVN